MLERSKQYELYPRREVRLRQQDALAKKITHFERFVDEAKVESKTMG